MIYFALIFPLLSQQVVNKFPGERSINRSVLTVVVITTFFIHHRIHQSFPFSVSYWNRTNHHSPQCYISSLFFYVKVKDCKRQSIKFENVYHCRYFLFNYHDKLHFLMACRITEFTL